LLGCREVCSTGGFEELNHLVFDLRMEVVEPLLNPVRAATRFIRRPFEEVEGRFVVGDRLAQGASSVVHKATLDGVMYAARKMTKLAELNLEAMRQIRGVDSREVLQALKEGEGPAHFRGELPKIEREIDVHRGLGHHPNIAAMTGVLDVTVHGVTFPLYTLVELSHCTLADAFPLSDEEVCAGVLEHSLLESCREISPPRVLSFRHVASLGRSWVR